MLEDGLPSHPYPGHQVVDAWGRILLYPLKKAFAFAFFVFQLHSLLLQFLALLVVIILGANRTLIFFTT
jgi:hypothetical protein